MMSLYSVLLDAMGAACFTVSVSEILIHFRRREGRSYSLSLGVASLFTAAYCLLCAGQYSVQDPAQSVVWLRGEGFCLNIVAASFLWFISDATGAVPRLHLRLFTGWFLLCAAVQLIGFGNLTWIPSRPDVKSVTLLGYQITYNEVAAGPATMIQSVSALLYFAYIIWRLVTYRAESGVRKARPLIVVVSIIGAAVLSDLAVSLGLYNFIYLTEYAWLAAVLFSWFQKSDLVLQAAHAKEALEESEEKFRSLIEQSSEAILLADEAGIVIEYNRAAQALTGIPPLLALGKQVRDLIGLLSEGNSRLAEAPVPGVSEGSLLRPDGTLRHFRRNIFSIETNKGRRFGVIVHDITEEKHAREGLEASLQEKNVLLKEIHHRVKNNLQVVSSLLYLQESRATDPQNKSILKECRHQIITMALIHEDLYRSLDLRSVNFGAYIKRLIGRLAATFSSAARTTIEFQVDEVPLSIEKAIPCGLILNELCMNVFKHAFPEEGAEGAKLPGAAPAAGAQPGAGAAPAAGECEEPRLTIGLRKNGDGMVTMIVWDNGIGLPCGMDIAKTRTVGMQIVTTLVHQLHGSIHLEPGKGARFVVRFDAARQ